MKRTHKLYLVFLLIHFSLVFVNAQSKIVKEYLVTFKKPIGGIMYVDIVQESGKYQVYGYDRNGRRSSRSFGTISKSSDKNELKQLFESKGTVVQEITTDSYGSNPFAYNDKNKAAHKKGNLTITSNYFAAGEYNPKILGQYSGTGYLIDRRGKISANVKCRVEQNYHKSGYQIILTYTKSSGGVVGGLSVECEYSGIVDYDILGDVCKGDLSLSPKEISGLIKCSAKDSYSFSVSK